MKYTDFVNISILDFYGLPILEIYLFPEYFRVLFWNVGFGNICFRNISLPSFGASFLLYRILSNWYLPFDQVFDNGVFLQVRLVLFDGVGNQISNDVVNLIDVWVVWI